MCVLVGIIDGVVALCNLSSFVAAVFRATADIILATLHEHTHAIKRFSVISCVYGNRIQWNSGGLYQLLWLAGCLWGFVVEVKGQFIFCFH